MLACYPAHVTTDLTGARARPSRTDLASKSLLLEARRPAPSSLVRAASQVLDLEEGTSEHSVRRQFRRLAQQVHPDKCRCTGAEAAFKLISQAAAVVTGHSSAAAADGACHANGLAQPDRSCCVLPGWTQSKRLLQWGVSRSVWLGCAGADDASADDGPKWWEAWDVSEEQTGRKRQRREPADLESAERSAEQLRQLHALPIQALPYSVCAMPGRALGLTCALSCLPVASVVCEAALTMRP